MSNTCAISFCVSAFVANNSAHFFFVVLGIFLDIFRHFTTSFSTTSPRPDCLFRGILFRPYFFIKNARKDKSLRANIFTSAHVPKWADHKRKGVLLWIFPQYHYSTYQQGIRGYFFYFPTIPLYHIDRGLLRAFFISPQYHYTTQLQGIRGYLYRLDCFAM